MHEWLVQNFWTFERCDDPEPCQLLVSWPYLNDISDITLSAGVSSVSYPSDTTNVCQTDNMRMYATPIRLQARMAPSSSWRPCSASVTTQWRWFSQTRRFCCQIFSYQLLLDFTLVLPLSSIGARDTLERDSTTIRRTCSSIRHLPCRRVLCSREPAAVWLSAMHGGRGLLRRTWLSTTLNIRWCAQASPSIVSGFPG